MAKIGFCRTPSFSPDGRRLAFISDLGGAPQVWTVATSGGWPDLVTATDEPVDNVAWSPEGSWLAFSTVPGRGMNKQIYFVRPDGSDLRRVTDGQAENNFMGAWTPDGRYLTFASTRRTLAADADAYFAHPETGEVELVIENRGLGGFTDVSADGRHALLYRLVSRGNDDIFLVNLSDGREVLLTPHEGPGSFYGKFAPGGGAVYLRSDKDRDRAAFARIELREGAQPGPLEVLAARTDAVLEGFQINKQGTAAALIWNVAGRSELELFDLTLNKTLRSPALPGEIIGGLDFSGDGRLLAMHAQDAAAPADIWLLDLASDRFSQLTRSPHAGVDLSRLVRPRLAHFTAHDGLELSGWLYVPEGHPLPRPTVLSFHGGPEAQEQPDFNSTYQALLARGIAVFAPNVRGSSGFGKRFVNLDNGALRENAVKDIKSCVEYVVGAGVADPRRVGIMGESYGGYMTMAGLTEYPELFAAGADLYGIVNFETFLARTPPWMAAISGSKYGDPATEAEMLRRLSPVHKFDRVVAPTIVLHGALDNNVPPSEAEQVVSALEARGVPVEFVLFEDEGHAFRKTPNRIRAAVRIVRWFETHL